jgi:hypothetical protein
MSVEVFTLSHSAQPSCLSKVNTEFSRLAGQPVAKTSILSAQPRLAWTTKS